MFGPFASQHQKARRLASDWLELAEKVHHYRRDVLSDSDKNAIQTTAGGVRTLLKDKADTAKLKLGVESLEAVLRRTGGQHYPKSTLVENVEFFLVAAIVILGLRAFYIQPFKIPTNSMWPSYNGMTGQVYAQKADEPGPAGRLVNFIAQGASARRLDAPETGEVLLPLGVADGRGVVSYSQVPGRSWLVFPDKLREYGVFVGNRIVTFKVPLDFDMDWVFRDTYFPGDKRSFGEIASEKLARGELVEGTVNTAHGPERIRLLRTGRMVRAGERMLSFDILTGDQLFVDRASYHFVRPKTGDGFVFRTGNIPDLKTDQYYIKRLIGVPGDRIEVREPKILRNGEPITDVAAIRRNGDREGNYAGYFNGRPDTRYPKAMLFAGQEITVPPDGYLAMGDNSGNSLDGRYWGFVPSADIVGRPLMIYYPFTKRWGPAP
ncbi:signal peptidase [Verrucomicrobia bacterium IMCC26134]|jgi:signal peptidase I|nr:signal peptidase [Verrucomicrobia bacterium IMCC26134]